MLSWDQQAQSILDTAAAAVDVDRAVIAPGPDFARDCRMLAVHLAQAQTRPLAGDIAVTACATATVLLWQVTFVADCVPFPDGDGTAPSAEAVTRWSRTYQAEVQAVHEALTGLCSSRDLGVSCRHVVLEDAIPTGPGGGIATMAWPITVAQLG